MPLLYGYLGALGWSLLGAAAMALCLVLVLRIFTWLTPLDEWQELRNGNVGVAIVLAAVILAFAIAVAAALGRAAMPG
jgi:uncharacterized membrane protein YjfL (UPF0719 family)